MRRYIFLLAAIVLLLAQTLPTILSGRFTFAFDMGRDLLWVRNMVELKKPALIGPWGSIAGVYFGPLWYYLLAIPYTIFNGDPRAAVAIPLAGNLITIIIGWLFLRRQNHQLAADIFALLYSVSPMIVSLSSFAFHANLLPLTTLLFVIGLTPSKGLNLKIPLAALMASFAYHLEPAAAIMLTLFVAIWYLITQIKSKTSLQSFKSLKSMWLAFVLFIIPFIPQLIFELRHNFVQTNSLISYFRGENPSLGGVLPLSQRITERLTKISDTVSYSLLSNEVEFLKLIFVFIFLFACLTTGFLPAGRHSFGRPRQPRNDAAVNYSRLTIYFILFHYFAYTLIFPAELKNWYLSGFASLFILASALIIEKVFGFKRLAGISVTAALILWNTQGLTKLFPKFNQTAAPETLTAQLQVVNWIYQDSSKTAEPFSIYTYTPPIYDYTYQYLIWWRGTKRYRKLPAEFSYLPGEISYLPEKEKFASATANPEDAKVFYLVLEPDTIQSRKQGWLGHFAATTAVSKIDFSSGITVEKRLKL